MPAPEVTLNIGLNGATIVNQKPTQDGILIDICTPPNAFMFIGLQGNEIIQLLGTGENISHYAYDRKFQFDSRKFHTTYCTGIGTTIIFKQTRYSIGMHRVTESNETEELVGVDTTGYFISFMFRELCGFFLISNSSDASRRLHGLEQMKATIKPLGIKELNDSSSLLNKENVAGNTISTKVAQRNAIDCRVPMNKLGTAKSCSPIDYFELRESLSHYMKRLSASVSIKEHTSIFGEPASFTYPTLRTKIVGYRDYELLENSFTMLQITKIVQNGIYAIAPTVKPSPISSSKRVSTDMNITLTSLCYLDKIWQVSLMETGAENKKNAYRCIWTELIDDDISIQTYIYLYLGANDLKMISEHSISYELKTSSYVYFCHDVPLLDYPNIPITTPFKRVKNRVIQLWNIEQFFDRLFPILITSYGEKAIASLHRSRIEKLAIGIVKDLNASSKPPLSIEVIVSLQYYVIGSIRLIRHHIRKSVREDSGVPVTRRIGKSPHDVLHSDICLGHCNLPIVSSDTYILIRESRASSNTALFETMIFLPGTSLNSIDIKAREACGIPNESPTSYNRPLAGFDETDNTYPEDVVSFNPYVVTTTPFLDRETLVCESSPSAQFKFNVNSCRTVGRQESSDNWFTTTCIENAHPIAEERLREGYQTFQHLLRGKLAIRQLLPITTVKSIFYLVQLSLGIIALATFGNPFYLIFPIYFESPVLHCDLLAGFAYPINESYASSSKTFNIAALIYEQLIIIIEIQTLRLEALAGDNLNSPRFFVVDYPEQLAENSCFLPYPKLLFPHASSTDLAGIVNFCQPSQPIRRVLQTDYAVFCFLENSLIVYNTCSNTFTNYHNKNLFLPENSCCSLLSTKVNQYIISVSRKYIYWILIDGRDPANLRLVPMGKTAVRIPHDIDKVQYNQAADQLLVSGQDKISFYKDFSVNYCPI